MIDPLNSITLNSSLSIPILETNISSSFTNEIKIDSLKISLKEYNVKNDKDLQFIDILGKISTEDKINISQNGQELLDQLNEEINKMKGEETYFENLESEMDKFVDLQKEIEELESKIESEQDQTTKARLEIELIKMESELLNLIK